MATYTTFCDSCKDCHEIILRDGPPDGGLYCPTCGENVPAENIEPAVDNPDDKLNDLSRYDDKKWVRETFPGEL